MKREQITELLAVASEQPSLQEQNLDLLVPFVYDELRRMAHGQLNREGHHATLNTTGLVHEAYLKLAGGAGVTDKGRSYFFGAAAQAMRQVLVEAARRRNRHKRGRGESPLTLEESQWVVDGFAAEILDLDAALSKLEREHPRPARVVECRFFGGLDMDQTAELLNVAPRTIARDWALARAWLHDHLDGAEGVPPAP